MRILVVDDNVGVRRSLAALLAVRAEWTVCGEAGDGEEAIAQTRALRPDLILMDVSMPGLDGIAATQRLRREWPEVRIILVSQSDAGRLEQQAKKADAAGWVAKSVLMEELIPCIDGVMARRGEHAAGESETARQPPGPREQTRLLERELERSKLLAALGELRGENCAEAFYEGMVETAAQLMRSDCASMQTVRGGAGGELELHLIASRGFSAEAQRAWAVVTAATGSTCGMALQEGRRVVVSEMARWGRISEASRVTYAQEGIQAVQSTPLVARNGKLVGMLSTHWKDVHQPSEDELRSFDILSRSAADLIEQRQAEEDLRASEHAYRRLAERLEVKVRERTEALEAEHGARAAQAAQLQRLTAELVQLHEEERKQIAREMHDSVGQTLAVLGMETGRLAAQVRRDLPEATGLAEQVSGLVRQLAQEIRTTSYLLYPPLLEESGLADALRGYVNGLTARTETQIRLEVDAGFGRFPADTELTLYRIAQECLTNVHRHSGSPEVVVRLAQANGEVSLEVEDHGRGIAREVLEAIQQGRSGVGMRGMTERLRQLQGELTVRSGAGGTTIRASVPARARGAAAGVMPSVVHG